MPDYKLGKIYKITDANYTEQYIGSTCEPTLARRFAGHRGNYKSYLKGGKERLTSFKLFDKYGIENCKIELIENYPCSTKDELKKKEGEYIKKLKCVNRCIPCQTVKEHDQTEKRKANKKKALEKFRKTKKAKDYVKSYHKKYRQISFTCECRSKIKLENKSKHLKSQKHINYIKSLKCKVDRLTKVTNMAREMGLI